MAEKDKALTAEQLESGENLKETIPDHERRRILRKLATGAFVAPVVMLVLEGGTSITYAY